LSKDYDLTLALWRAEQRAIRLHGWAGLLRGLAVGFGFGMLGALVGGGQFWLVSLVLAGLAVACLVGAWDLDKSADRLE
jgi:high-affinity Fe2+/Pb2+ permease